LRAALLLLLGLLLARWLLLLWRFRRHFRHSRDLATFAVRDPHVIDWMLDGV